MGIYDNIRARIGGARTSLGPSAPGPGPETPPPPEAPGPSQPFHREQFRDQWMGTGSDANAQNALLGQHNLTLDPAGRTTLPTGETIDLRLGAKAGGTQATWTGVAGGGAKAGQAPDMGGGGGMSGGGGSAGGFNDQIRSLLLSQLQGLSKPVSATDPTIQGEMSAQGGLLERIRQQRRAAMAERMAASGLNSGGAGSGAMESEIAAGFEDKGQQLSGIQSQLFSRELQSRRSQLAQLLSLAVQSGDAESARALQLQLGQMDNELRRYTHDDTMGFNANRAAEDDLRWRYGFGFGG